MMGMACMKMDKVEHQGTSARQRTLADGLLVTSTLLRALVGHAHSASGGVLTNEAKVALQVAVCILAAMKKEQQRV